MSTANQEKLENAVAKLIKKHGVEQAVKIIKNYSPSSKLFANRQHYPNGVFIHCNSPKGGILVGTKKSDLQKRGQNVEEFINDHFEFIVIR